MFDVLSRAKPDICAAGSVPLSLKIAGEGNLMENIPINRFVGTHPDDIEKKKRRVKIPIRYQRLLNIAGKEGYLAGGAVRFLLTKDKKIVSRDFDFYAYTAESRTALHDNFIKAGFKLKKENQNCWWLEKDEDTVQVIKSFCGPIEQVLDEFDFTICRAATDGKHIWRDKDFYSHCRKKLLILKTIQCPIAAIRRIVKYSKKGFFITNFQIIKLYEDYIARGTEYRTQLLSILEKQEKSARLSQADFEELEAILIKVD